MIDMVIVSWYFPPAPQAEAEADTEEWDSGYSLVGLSTYSCSKKRVVYMRMAPSQRTPYYSLNPIRRWTILVHTPRNGSSIRRRLDSVQHPSLQAYVDLAFDRDSRVSRALLVARHQTG